MLAKRTSKNQLTLPKEIADAFIDTEYFDVTAEGRKIILAPVKMVPADAALDLIRKKMKALGIQENDVAVAVKWARRQRR